MKLSKISRFIGADLIGNPEDLIDSISSIDNPKENSIILVTKSKFITKKILESSATFLTFPANRNFFKNSNLLLSEDPAICFSKLTNIFAKEKQRNLEYSDRYSSFISQNTSVGENFFYGNGVIVEDFVTIGKNVKLGHNVVIHNKSYIGDNVIIDSGTIIGSEGFGNTLDKDGSWLHIHHLGGVEIKKNVHIGANCTIDRGTIDNTVIESGVIIDNQVHIAHNVHIGENTAIAAKVGIAGSCKIGKRNMIGGMVGIIDHIITADDVIISATSTVNKNLKESGTYTGIMPISKHAIWKRIALWITKLDKIVNLKKIKES